MKRGVSMAAFNEVVGHEDIVSHFKASIERGMVSHAYILNGEKGSGKKFLAGLFAKTLQCEEGKTDPCGQCHSCKQYETGNQPDIIWVTHEKDSVISVDEVRTQINNDIAIKPYSSRYKIYIVDDVQLMNPQAQNAILKTIEEPPEYGIIILLTTNIDRLLPTLLSRCITLNLKPVREIDVMDYLMDKVGVDRSTAYFCTSFALGNLGKAVRLAVSEDYKAIKEDCVRILKNIYSMDTEDVLAAVKSMGKYKLDMNDYIDLMTMWYRDILMLKVTGNIDKLLFKEDYSTLNEQASLISYEGIENVMAAINKLKIRLEANVNYDIAMELLLLTIKENRNG